MFQTFLIEPIYNLFVFLLSYMPQGDVGLAIIALTILMRLILYPIFTSSIRTQMNMQAMQAEMDVVSEKYKDDAEALGRERLALMRKYKVNPLSAIAALLVQVLLFISLGYALFREGFPHINEELLYSFVHAPAAISTNFFGLVDLLTPHHLILAALVAITQFMAIYFTVRRTKTSTANLTAEKAQAQQMQQQTMLYIMPPLMGVFSYFFFGAMGLYFTVSNLFSVFQEWVIAKQKQ